MNIIIPVLSFFAGGALALFLILLRTMAEHPPRFWDCRLCRRKHDEEDHESWGNWKE